MPSFISTLATRIYANAYILLVVGTFFWSCNAVISRMAVGEVTPAQMVFYRWLLVGLVIALCMRRHIPDSIALVRRHWGRLLLMGASLSIFTLLLYSAAVHTKAINIGIIQGTIPIIVIAITAIILRHSVSVVQLVAIMITMGGVMMVSVRGSFDVLFQLAFNIGDLIMLTACFVYGGYTVSLKNRPPLHGLVFFGILSLVAAAVALPFFCYDLFIAQSPPPSDFGWLLVLFVAFFPSFVSQVFFIRSVELIGPARSGVFVNLIPILSPILAVLLLSEKFMWYHAASLVLVLSGIYLSEHHVQKMMRKPCIREG